MEKVQTLKLDSPYFSAWKKYNWANGTWGLGISLQFLNSATKAGNDVIVEYESKYKKHVWFCKTSDLRDYATKYYPEFIAGQTTLLVFPVTMFTEVNEAPLEVFISGFVTDIHHKLTEPSNQKLCIFTVSDGVTSRQCVVAPRGYEDFFAAHTILLGEKHSFATTPSVSKNNKAFFSSNPLDDLT